MSPAILALLALTAGEPVTLRAGTPTALEQVPVVSPGFLQEDYPAVAWGGGNFLAVWAGYGLTRARIDIGGNVLDPVGRPLWERPSLVDGAYPALIHDGSRFVLAWSSSAGVFAARLDTAGVPVDPAPVSIASGRAGAIALATSGSRHLLVWVGAPGTMLASILDPELCPAVAAPFALDSTGGLKQQPAAGFNGQSFLAVWVEDDGTFNYSLRFARIDTNGNVLDSPEKVLVANGGNAPRVASDGVNFLVVWEQPSSEPFNPVRYFAARIDAAGAILDSPLLLGGEPGFNPAPAVVFDTVNYVVTWPDRRGGTYAARVTPGGTVLDPGGFPINAGQPGRICLDEGLAAWRRSVGSWVGAIA